LSLDTICFGIAITSVLDKVQSHHRSCSIFIWMISLESMTVLNGNLLL